MANNQCKYNCDEKDIKDLEEHYQIDHAMNQGLRDPIANEGAKLTQREDRPDLVEAREIADKERMASAKKQVHPVFQKDEKAIKEVIVTTEEHKAKNEPKVSTAQKVKSEQDNMGTASSQPK